MNTPIRVDNCPIIDSVVELRFSSNVHSNAVFGIVYNLLKEDYPNVDKLGILQLPEQYRESNDSLKYKPHYKINNGEYSIQIGPCVFAIGAPMPYAGWDGFSSTVFDLVNKLLDSEVTNKVERLGMRVINFFENEDIFSYINLNLEINNETPNLSNTVVRTQLQLNDCFNTLQIANSVSQKKEDAEVKGSIIDIDTFRKYDDDFDFKQVFKDEIKLIHETEKEMFFSLLNEEFLRTLNPIY